VKDGYGANIGIDLASLAAWAKIDELRSVANSVKHAEGGSARQLRQVRPDLFQSPAFAEIRPKWEAGGLIGTNRSRCLSLGRISS
jgi:hypothetical protein